jgi:predicted nucleotidyltransferase
MSTREDVGALRDEVAARIRGVLGPKLLGLILWGSYVVGDFNPRLSDLDLVAVLSADVDAREFAQLEQMHAALAGEFPDWVGRIEVRYATVETLNRPEAGGEIVSISPGEPLNRRASAASWQVDWYVVRERGIALSGPPPATLLAPISRTQFVAAARADVASWTDWSETARGHRGHASVILRLCRALRTTLRGDQLSKPAAGRWAQQAVPEWADLIGRALAWREAPEDAPGAPPDAETHRFVKDLRQHILAASPGSGRRPRRRNPRDAVTRPDQTAGAGQRPKARCRSSS